MPLQKLGWRRSKTATAAGFHASQSVPKETGRRAARPRLPVKGRGLSHAMLLELPCCRPPPVGSKRNPLQFAKETAIVYLRILKTKIKNLKMMEIWL